MKELDRDFGKLNPDQKEIIKKFRGPAIITAGPGTGKTRTIAVLIGRLLAEGSRLKEILALTFSDKAARELRERVLSYHPFSFDECWISTFHSFCARVLRDQFHVVGIDPEFKLLTSFKEALLMDGICRNLDPRNFPFFQEILGKRGFQQEALTFIGLLKSNLVEPGRLENILAKNDAFDKRTKGRLSELLTLYYLFEKEREKSGYLDFRDLIRLVVKVFRDPELVRKYREKFKVVLVDEFQDTDPAQFFLLSLLKEAEEKPRIAVIGDPRQSIYRFRGADPHIISTEGPFKTAFKAKQFSLSRNYRSAEPIVTLAGNLNWMEKGAKSGGDSLKAESDRAGTIEFFEVGDEIEEARLIGRRIAAMLIWGTNRRYRTDEIAVLVRNNYQIDLIVEALQSLSIPFTIAGDMKFFRSEEVQLLSALLKAAGGTGDDENEALKRAFSSPLLKLDSLWVQSILAKLGPHGNLKVFLRAFSDGLPEGFSEPGEETRVRALAFGEMLHGLQSAGECPLSTALARIFLVLGEHLADIKQPGAVNLLHFRNLATDVAEVIYRQHSRVATITDFLRDFDQWLTYYASTLETEDTPVAGQGVKLMTIHQAKGLEFPVVFLPGLCEGMFPVDVRQNTFLGREGLKQLKEAFDTESLEIPFFNPYPDSFDDHLEEERRLFYVGITRAQEGLILTSPKRIGAEPAIPSPFLKELRIPPAGEWAEVRPLSIGELRIKLAELDESQKETLKDDLVRLGEALPRHGLLRGVEPRVFGEVRIDQVQLPGTFVFSAQSIKDYLDCPRRFFFKRVLRIRNPLEEFAPAIIEGNATHLCLEKLHAPDGPWEVGKMPDDEDLETLWEKWGEPLLYPLDPLERISRTRRIREALRNYRDAVHGAGQIPPRQTRFAEKTLRFPFRGYSCLARCDRVTQAQDGLWIIDYKTSGPRTTEKVFQLAFPENEVPTEIQLPFYLLAFREKGFKEVGVMTLYVAQPPYVKKYKSFEKGFLKSAALNLGAGPGWGKAVSEEAFAAFSDRMGAIMKQMTEEKVFDCHPSTHPEARSCRSGPDPMACEFFPYCQDRLEELRDCDPVRSEGFDEPD